MDGISNEDLVPPRADLVRERLEAAISVKKQMVADSYCDQVVDIARVMITALRSGNKVIFFGNGGSAQDAGHLAAELMGRFAFDRPGLSAMSLPDATAAMTAIGNDYSYAEVYARQVLAAGRPGDVAVGLSTSGNSENVVRALKIASEADMITVAMTGEDGGMAARAAKISLQVPTVDTARVQEACMHAGHTICEMVEAALFPQPGVTYDC
jgi:D-sedoheptulose 7-phosphate isomerase